MEYKEVVKNMKGIEYLNQELQKIKEKKGSFIGMDGGNPKADFWFCGVEFGSSIEDMALYYEEYVMFYEEKGFLIPYRKDCPEKYLKSIFDKFLASIYSNLYKKNEYPNKEEIDSILRNELYNKTSNIFKLNLFPIAKNDISWDKNFESKLNVTKNEYYGTIFKNRIKFIKELAEEFKPKVIVCFSPKDYSEYFERTFFNIGEQINYLFDSIELNNGRIGTIKVYESNLLKVITIPFLGRGNLASYEDVRIMTNYLKEKYFYI